MDGLLELKNNRMKNLNQYIKKSHLRMVEKFNEELEAFRKETEAEVAELYEDAFTSFTLANVRVEDGRLIYDYDGQVESEKVVLYDEEENEYYEDEIDGITEYIKFWRACLRRAKRYWSMDVEKLDKIQNGDIDDEEEEED